MADPILNGKLIQEFQIRFGSPPGSGEPATERQQWEQLCQELLEDRDRLRAEMAKTQGERQQYHKSLLTLLAKEMKPEDYDFTYEEILAQSDKGQSLQDFIAELEQTHGS